MTSLLERAARAAEFADEAFVAQYPGPGVVARADPDWSKAVARAVLEAIREPSEGMLSQGRLMWDEMEDMTADTWRAMIDAALKGGETDQPTEISLGFDVVTSKEAAIRRARIVRQPVTVELRFPIGQWEKPEDMIGHAVRVEASGAPFGEYLAESVDDRGRVVLQPFQLDRDYDWTEREASDPGRT
ncbi:hypothetical protein [Sphingopyxis sp. NJF-3]